MKGSDTRVLSVKTPAHTALGPDSLEARVPHERLFYISGALAHGFPADTEEGKQPGEGYLLH